MTAPTAVDPHRHETRSRRGWGAVLLLGSVVLLGVAAGVGYPFLLKVGWSAGAVVGALALAGGVLLLAVGLRWVLRGHPWWVSVPVTALTLVLVLLGAYVVAVPLAVTASPHPPRGDGTPASVGLSFTEVDLPTRDGETLAGWLVEPRNDAAVVLLPGAGSDASATLEHAAVLAGGGYGVLMVDPRGHGASSGDGMEWGWHGDTDIAAALDLLERTPSVDPDRLAVLGLSVGGEQAVGAAASDPRVAAVVAEGVTGRSAADLAWLSEEYGWRGSVTEAVKELQTALVSGLAGAEPPVTLVEAVAATTSPLLVVAAGEDVDEQHVADRLESAAPDRVEVWVVSGSGHTAGLRTSPQEWEQRVLGFLDRALGR